MFRQRLRVCPLESVYGDEDLAFNPVDGALGGVQLALPARTPFTACLVVRLDDSQDLAEALAEVIAVDDFEKPGDGGLRSECRYGFPPAPGRGLVP